MPIGRFEVLLAWPGKQRAAWVHTKPFENVVVFGPSLAAPDYSYFFPILDKLHVMDADAPGKSSSPLIFTTLVEPRK